MNLSLNSFKFLLNRLLSSKKNFCFLFKDNGDFLQNLLEIESKASTLAVTPTEEMHLVRDIICAIQAQDINQKLLIITESQFLNIAQQSALSQFLDSYSGLLQVVFLSTDDLKHLKNLQNTCSTIEILKEHSEKNEERKRSLRELMVPYFVNLPQKDEKSILGQIDDIAQALQEEFLAHQDPVLQKSLITLIDYLSDILSSPIQGQLLARAIKWNCYRYLKSVKSAKST